MNSVGPLFGPRPHKTGPPRGHGGPEHRRGACGACGAHDHRVLALSGGTGGAGSPAVELPRGHRLEHTYDSGGAIGVGSPGKEVRSGTHPDGATTMRVRYTIWRHGFIDVKSARWSVAAGEQSCSTTRLRGWVRYGKSGNIRAHGGTL
jgi:hypothetical protein